MESILLFSSNSTPLACRPPWIRPPTLTSWGVHCRPCRGHWAQVWGRTVGLSARLPRALHHGDSKDRWHAHSWAEKIGFADSGMDETPSLQQTLGRKKEDKIIKFSIKHLWNIILGAEHGEPGDVRTTCWCLLSSKSRGWQPGTAIGCTWPHSEGEGVATTAPCGGGGEGRSGTIRLSIDLPQAGCASRISKLKC